MKDTTDKDQSVYEIGYLIASVSDEKVLTEAETIKKIITDAGSSIIVEEPPHRQQLAYTISKKMVSGGYEKYDFAHFGWVKFELGSDKIEAVKKAIELHPSILRILLISTVRENTYLGKRVPAMTISSEFVATPGVGVVLEDKKEIVAPVTIEEMDKSIDDLIKGGI